MLVSKALEDSFNEGKLEGLNEGIDRGIGKILRSLLRSELESGSSKEKAFEKMIALDPSIIDYDLLEEVYSSLDD